MIARRLLGSRSSRNSALASGTTRSWRPLMIVTGVVICGSSSASSGSSSGYAADVAHRLDVAVARRSRRGSPRGCRRGSRPRSCPGTCRRSRAGPCGGTCRGRGRAPATRSGSPSSSGTAAPPEPTITLAIRSGCAAAANRAAEVPTSGATMCGVPEIGLGDEPGQEPAHRPRRQEIVPALGRAEPRQVDGEQAGVLGERGPHPRERVQALRPGARQQHAWPCASRRCRRTGSSVRRSSGTGARSMWSAVVFMVQLLLRVRVSALTSAARSRACSATM